MDTVPNSDSNCCKLLARVSVSSKVNQMPGIGGGLGKEKVDRVKDISDRVGARPLYEVSISDSE